MRPNAVLLESLLQQFSESINKFQGRVDPHQGVKLVGQICSMNMYSSVEDWKETQQHTKNVAMLDAQQFVLSCICYVD